MTDDERLHLAAWARVDGLGPKRLTAMAAALGGYAAAWRHQACALAAAGLGPKGAAAARRALRGLDPAACAAADRAIGARVVAPGDDDYPAGLHALADPPAALWVLGAWPPPEAAIGVVGARQASPYGERIARRLGRDLAAAGVVVVSGAAAGIDRAAHEGALEAGWTVAVLGCGLGHVYPANHRALYGAIARTGTLLTEHPPEARPMPGHFPRRNRLIAALSRGVAIVEARARSGSLITADLALELGREVFAVPGPVGAPGSEGPHLLLREGATLVRDAGDVLEAFGWTPAPAAAAVALDPDAAAVLGAIAPTSSPADALARATGLTPAATAAALMRLELAGLVRSLPGARYAPV